MVSRKASQSKQGKQVWCLLNPNASLNSVHCGLLFCSSRCELFTKAIKIWTHVNKYLALFDVSHAYKYFFFKAEGR